MKVSVLSWVAIFFIKVYKVLLSPIIGNHCRFVPSCSTYAIEALKEHGFFKGSYLMIKRILRCHPWGGSGYDPVPSKVVDENIKKEEEKR